MFFPELSFFFHCFFTKMSKNNIAYAVLSAPIYLSRDSGMAKKLVTSSSHQIYS